MSETSQTQRRSLHYIFRFCFSLPFAAFIFPGSAPAVELRHSPLDDEADFRRFIWVTRWDYQSPSDIERICYNAASARFTDLLFQVRGEGTVFFKSPYEPWAWELSGRGPERGVGVNPGWDPLAVALREGKRRGLRVHAWINVMPAWNQKVSPPKDSGQLYVAHKSWLMVDADGRTMRPNNFYAFLDPGLPDVRDYLGKVVGRLAKDYALDGVHLDYIRYPVPDETGREFSFHPAVVKDFKQWSGKKPEQAGDQWLDYRRRQVTATVRQIRESVNRARPGLELSASVMADVDKGRNLAGQDAQRWLNEGLVDAVAPMCYVRNDMSKFRSETNTFLGSQRAKQQVWVGIWPRKENPSYLDQICESARQKAAGVAIFSYGELFPEHRVTHCCVDVYHTFISGCLGGPERKSAQAVVILKSQNNAK